MKVLFRDEEIVVGENEFVYLYSDPEPKNLYKLLRYLVICKESLEFQLLSEKILARKFYEILNNEFNEVYF